MLRLDDFITDRIFQPISDRLARWVSCYALAAFILTGATLLFTWSSLKLEDWSSIAFVTPFFAFWAWRADRLDRSLPTGALPRERLTMAPLRVFYLFTEPLGWPFTYELWFVGRQWYLGCGVAFVMALVGLYFMACSRNPPPPRRVTSLQPA